MALSNAPSSADAVGGRLKSKVRTMDRHELQKDGKHPAPCARFCEANAFKIELRNLQLENFRLREAICRTLQENEHLADGEDCTLIHIKRAMQSNA